MKIKPLIAGSVGAGFALSVVGATYHDNHDGRLHLPPGNASLVLALSTATGTTTAVISTMYYSAVHDAEYVPPADTTPLKSDGQAEKA